MISLCYSCGGTEHRVKPKGSPKPVGRRSAGAGLGLSAIVVVLSRATFLLRSPPQFRRESPNLQPCSSLQVRLGLGQAWLSRCRPKPVMSCFNF